VTAGRPAWDGLVAAVGPTMTCVLSAVTGSDLQKKNKGSNNCSVVCYLSTWPSGALAGTMNLRCASPLRSTGMMPLHPTWQHQMLSTCELLGSFRSLAFPAPAAAILERLPVHNLMKQVAS
jgi:hypothetical protein